MKKEFWYYIEKVQNSEKNLQTYNEAIDPGTLAIALKGFLVFSGLSVPLALATIAFVEKGGMDKLQKLAEKIGLMKENKPDPKMVAFWKNIREENKGRELPDKISLEILKKEIKNAKKLKKEEKNKIISSL